MSENISKKSSFKKNVNDEVGKHDVLIYLLQQIY